MQTDAKIVQRLPSHISAEIGRICYAYALLEHELRSLAYVLVGTDQKRGRIAVRDPRGKEMVDMIRDLLITHGNTPDKKFWQLLRDTVEHASTERDKLAHGIWLRSPLHKQIFLRVTRGTWQPERGQKGTTSRKIKPQGFLFEELDTKGLLRVIANARKLIREVGKGLDSAIRASLKKSDGQHRAPIRHPHHKK